MSVDDNISRQADEVEALSAIYGDEWCVLDAAHRIFCIRIEDNTEIPKWSLSLQVHLPEKYPLEAPPEYGINAGWLKGEERIQLENRLGDIYCDNIGHDVIYLLVEGVREFLQEKADKESPPDGLKRGARSVVQSTEVSSAEDDFDSAVLGDWTSVTYAAVTDSVNAMQEVVCPEIIHGGTLTDRRSTFQAHLALVTDKAQVPVVLHKLYENKKIANATHNMVAYRITSGAQAVVVQGCDDDGETHAGSRMLHLLQIMDVENVMVVVSRWYGGIQLGPDRFKHINNCTREILEQNGFSREKGDKKCPRSNKKR